MAYSDKVLDHYENPRNVGVLDKDDPNVGTGMVGAPACGDVMRLQIKVSEDGVVEDAKFKTYGCGSAIASSSLVTEMVKGKTLEEVEAIKNQDIVDELALPKSVMAITMTERAAEHVRSYIEKRGKGIGLRLAVRTTGCSGMAYVLEFADEVAANDEVFEQHDLKVVVDQKSLVYLDGTELDFAKEGLNEGFQFKNPNVKDECGCGESFNI